MKFIFLVFVNDGILQTSATVREFMEGVLAMREGNLARNYEVQGAMQPMTSEADEMRQARQVGAVGKRLVEADLREYLKAGARANKSKE